MSTLKELLNKHCPNGVEFKKMSDICKSIKTGKLDANAMEENGKYRFYTCAKEYYKINTYAFDCEALLISGNGANVGYIHYYKGKFNAYQRTYVLTNFTENILYIKYFLNSKLKERIDKEKKTGNTPYIRLNTLTDMIIPVPPIEVQKEIVRILDEFTEKTTKLQELLHRETILRKKQYEYYRDKLLTFDDDIELKKLGEIANISRGGKLQKKDFVNNGFPCIHYGQIHTKYSLFPTKTFSFIPYEIADKEKKASKNDIIMAVTSENVDDVCKCIAWLGNTDVAVGGHTAIISHNQNPKYLAYYFNTSMFFYQKIKIIQGTKVMEVSPNKLKNILVPVPPLEEQERIVNILDKFDALCNDITKGLPAEIEMRKKQYEYYRDKLLTFKEKKK